MDNKEEDENNCFNFDINTSQTSCKFYEGINSNEEPISEKTENNNKNSKTTLKCINHQNVDAIMKCTHCNNLYCEICSNKIKKESSYVNHILINLEEVLSKKESEKEKSLNIFSKILEIYIYKFNYIFNLNNDEICLPSFPNEKSIYDTNSQQNFLSEINSIYLAYILNFEDNNENNENEINEYNNKISLKNCNVNSELIKSIENIFKNQKINIEKNINDYDDDFYSDEYALDYEIEFEDIKNSFFYFINVVKKHNFDFNKDISIDIINKFKQVLNINKSNIFLLFDNKIDNYIKSKQFDEIPIEEFDIENPMFKNFYKLKMFIENLLIKECKISKDKLDYRGNFINPNSRGNLIRGTEFYDPPVGWIGIGLNVIEKYNDDKWLNDISNQSEWAIAYHGINSKYGSNNIKILLNNIIMNDGLKYAISDFKSQSHDKRSSNIIGKGIYLTPFIKIAESYTGIISFNKKNYKVVLMSKVKIKKIREPEGTKFWVLDKDYIRIYRILLKEVDN